MNIPEVKPGDTVAYVPGVHHWNDLDGEARVFAFEHMHDGPMRSGVPLYRKGDVKTNLHGLGALEHRLGSKRDPDTGHVTTAGGHTVKPTRPVRSWKAVVLAVKADGKCDLQIQHPQGHLLECPAVPFDAAGLKDGVLHSWHMPEGA